MWTPKTPIAVACLLVLSSCGTGIASTSQDSTPAVVPSTPDTTPETTTPDATTSTIAGIADAEAAFPARLALTTSDGHIVTFSPHDDPVVTPGVTAPSGQVVVSADSHAGRTMVEWHHLRNDQISAQLQLDGDLRPTAVAQDGKLVALVGSSGTTTTVVLATPSKGEVRRWQFDAVLVPEAFSNAFEAGGDGLPIGVFVIEYLA